MYLLVIIGIILGMWASINVKSKFNKYSNITNSSSRNAEDICYMILRANGIHDVNIERIDGMLTDHYDPRSKTLRLSSRVYGHNSIAAIGVAAHECGHAIQHATAYGPLVLRSKLVPVVNISSTISEILILLGVVFGAMGLVDIGILAFSIIVIFYFVTLPVEFDASRRACNFIENSGYFLIDDTKHARKVLTAAAMTYVTSALVALLQLIRLMGLRRD